MSPSYLVPYSGERWKRDADAARGRRMPAPEHGWSKATRPPSSAAFTRNADQSMRSTPATAPSLIDDGTMAAAAAALAAEALAPSPHCPPGNTASADRCWLHAWALLAFAACSSWHAVA